MTAPNTLLELLLLTQRPRKARARVHLNGLIHSIPSECTLAINTHAALMITSTTIITHATHNSYNRLFNSPARVFILALALSILNTG